MPPDKTYSAASAEEIDATLTPLDCFAGQRLWVRWRSEVRGGKRTKIPFALDRRPASVTDPSTWSTRAELELDNAGYDGVGIMLAQLAPDQHLGGVDLDSCLNDEGDLADWARPILELLDSYTEVSPSSRGLKVFFTHDPRETLAEDVRWKSAVRKPASGGHGPAIEFYLKSRYFTVTGRVFERFDALRHVPTDALRELQRLMLEAFPDAERKPNGHDREPPNEHDLALDCLANIRNDGRFASRSAWLDVGMAVHDATGGSTAGLAAWIAWTARAGHANAREACAKDWASFRLGGGRSLGTLIKFAREDGFDPYRQRRHRNGHDRKTPPSAGPVPGSEDAIALDFIGEHGDRLAYIAEQGQWLRWEQTHWAEDRTVAVFDLIRPLVRSAAISEPKSGRKIATASTVAGVERLARTDRRVATVTEQYDADPLALNTPAGILDLRTGEVRPCDPAALCTKITSCAPRAGIPGRWLAFLDQVTDHDRDLIAYLQRMAGYMLTGDTSEHALFFGHGTGANGKGTFVHTLRGLMGNYAMVAPADVFLASAMDRHPTEVADLRGARLVVSSEIDEGRRWNESRLKTLTGGDPIKARKMRQDFFEYLPQFKLLIIGNHRPTLKTVDEAIRRRMNLLPFTVTIPKAARDPRLMETLRAEWPEILQWAIEGCAMWQRTGLQPPERVQAATEEYLDTENLFTRWFEERCERDRKARETSARLFQSWSQWCEHNGEKPGTAKTLGTRFLDLGFEPFRTRAERGFLGVRVIQAAGDAL